MPGNFGSCATVSLLLLIIDLKRHAQNVLVLPLVSLFKMSAYQKKNLPPDGLICNLSPTFRSVVAAGDWLG